MWSWTLKTANARTMATMRTAANVPRRSTVLVHSLQRAPCLDKNHSGWLPSIRRNLPHLDFQLVGCDADTELGPPGVSGGLSAAMASGCNPACSLAKGGGELAPSTTYASISGGCIVLLGARAHAGTLSFESEEPPRRLSTWQREIFEIF